MPSFFIFIYRDLNRAILQGQQQFGELLRCPRACRGEIYLDTGESRNPLQIKREGVFTFLFSFQEQGRYMNSSFLQGRQFAALF